MLPSLLNPAYSSEWISSAFTFNLLLMIFSKPCSGDWCDYIFYNSCIPSDHLSLRIAQLMMTSIALTIHYVSPLNRLSYAKLQSCHLRHILLVPKVCCQNQWFMLSLAFFFQCIRNFVASRVSVHLFEILMLSWLVHWLHCMLFLNPFSP